MEACIVVAKLIGMLYSEPIDVYKIECSESNHYIIKQEEKIFEVDFMDNQNIIILGENQ